MVSYILNKLILIPGVLIGFSIHEFGHAKAAQLCGDYTSTFMGRATIDPTAHVDLIGLLSLLLLGFGWGKPVMVNPANLKNPRRDSIIISLAGVFMNFCCAFVFAFLLRFFIQLMPGIAQTNVGGIIEQVFLGTVQINLSLMVFNLIPIPPLDGFNVVADLFNMKHNNPQLYYTLIRYGWYILMACIIFDITDILLMPGLNAAYRLVMNVAFIGM